MKKHILFLLMSIIIIGCSDDKEEYTIYAEGFYKDMQKSINMTRPEGSYNYPIVPGTDKWKEFESRDEMEKACQVPVNILREQSTQAVIQALIEYPLCTDVFAWDNYQKGYNFVFQPLNAYQEFLKRDDAVNYIIERYKIVSATTFKYPFSHYFLEMFLAQEYFIKQLSSKEKKDVVARCLDIINITNENPDFFDIYLRVGVSYFLMGRIMKYDNYTPFYDIFLVHPEWESFFEDDNYFVITDEKLNTFLGTIFFTAYDYIEQGPVNE
ncbi:MAG: hypothetical protein PHG27_08800 [Massilibacteroides sp.]|nr:hypothetical protein [Massilibacteroides sp.]MDD3062804.1 hypothetical protein [Massilibacteroides sp.]MDD4115672.1 hypothetical protein [Massilibacteroides sp.]MDD4659384.1 hypothetical protein [Massilibacteroides sp.]